MQNQRVLIDFRKNVILVGDARSLGGNNGFDIVVSHGDQLGSPTPALLHEAFPTAEIILFGHTHKPLLELVDRTVTVMNPGSAGPRRFDLPVTVGILELEPGIPPRGRIVALSGGSNPRASS